MLDEGGLAPQAASKLLARNRPHLVPLRGQHVFAALPGRDHADFIMTLGEALRADGMVDRVEQLRDETGGEELSVLRVLDIVGWEPTAPRRSQTDRRRLRPTDHWPRTTPRCPAVGAPLARTYRPSQRTQADLPVSR